MSSTPRATWITGPTLRALPAADVEDVVAVGARAASRLQQAASGSRAIVVVRAARGAPISVDAMDPHTLLSFDGARHGRAAIEAARLGAARLRRGIVPTATRVAEDRQARGEQCSALLHGCSYLQWPLLILGAAMGTMLHALPAADVADVVAVGARADVELV